MRTSRAFAIALLALFAFAFFTPTAAAARSYTHGLDVWSDGTTLGEGDEVRGDVNVVFGTVICDGPATIAGNVTVFFGEFDPQGQCVVTGTTSHVFGDNALQAFAPWTAESDAFFADNRGLFRKLGWDLVVLFAFLLFPVRMRVALDRTEKHPGLCALAGGVAMVAAVPIFVLLLLSIIGIPLLPLEIAALFAGLWIGQGAVALLVGRRLYELARPHATPSPLGALVLGLVLITAAEILPLVGWAVTALVSLVGLGAAVLAFVRETSFHSFAPTYPNPAVGTGAPPIGGPPMNRTA